MASFNKVILIGNLTRDPEIRYTPSGAALCSFGLAINDSYVNKQGEVKEETCFVDIDVWGKQAESSNRYLSKGKSVCIEGRLRFDQWDDRESGKKRSRLTVTAVRVQFLSGRGTDNQGDDAPKPPSSEEGTPHEQTSPVPSKSGSPNPAVDKKDDTMDDIPF